jgi:hypothetical protein
MEVCAFLISALNEDELSASASFLFTFGEGDLMHIVQEVLSQLRHNATLSYQYLLITSPNICCHKWPSSGVRPHKLLHCTYSLYVQLYLLLLFLKIVYKNI